ncbi:aminoglycoside phosphotransferase family protein [Nonomuraea harbinensis]|uniref:Aminoglycoside phosphotransferase family protein n=1 Tax=Nonomuraea harbinensis TaxID=1286938 RepID=A0ABW1C695_9ACTN|nr:phosphotransferase [Nonomuraea harbinensis]
MTFSKPYATREALEQTIAHHAWLSEHGGPLRLPGIVAVRANGIDFTSVEGRHARSTDAPAVATVLGRAHAAAWKSDLHRALLTTAHPLAGGRELPDFISPRIAALRRHGDAGFFNAHQVAAAQSLLAANPAIPVAFYKDTNPRNVLITADGPVMVDFDDLTLAPFGYDLAKLLVTLAMTYGPLPPGTFTTALARYNKPLLDADLPAIPIGQLLDHAELHHLLTLPYLGKGGYRHPWPTVRPRPEDLT